MIYISLIICRFVKGETEEATEEDKKKPLEDLNLEEVIYIDVI